MKDKNKKDKKIIVLFFGTRPEIIKLFVLYRILKESDEFYPVLYNTAQQKISNDIMQHLDLQFDYLSEVIPNRSSDLNQLVSHLIGDFNNKFSDSSEIKKSEIAGIVVQGDTASAYCGAIWGFLNQIPIFHVEAGLRTFDHLNPFPEEFFRESIGRASTLNFCPSNISYDNLVREGVSGKKNYVVGNTINDAIITLIKENKIKEPDFDDYILSTLHRRENWDNVYNYAKIIKSVLKNKHDSKNILHIMHPNPRVQESFATGMNGKYPDNLIIREPINDYFEMLGIVKHSSSILTDSGGLQEESLFFNVPCGILRKVTERPEVLSKNAKLLPFDNSKISEFLTDSEIYNHDRKTEYDYTYGYGNTSELIYEILKNFYE